MSKKILAFDSWTESAPHLLRLVQPLRDRGIELMMLHIGSWGHDVGRPQEERIGSLLVRDISYYEGMSFAEILEKESPDGVMLLSLQAFAHRAFNRYCAFHGVPTMHVYHGLVSVQSMAATPDNQIDRRRQFALVVERAPKNLKVLLPAYARSLWDTRAGIRDWVWFGFDIWRKLRGISYSGRGAHDTMTRCCCVYTEADVPHAQFRYRMPRESIAVVGNPDLATMGVLDADLAVAVKRQNAEAHTIVYIDSALVTVGEVFSSEAVFVEHLVETRDELAAAGFQLIVKLHPSQLRTDVPNQLRRHGVAECRNDDFLPILRSSRAAITEPSSASMIPALLGLPLLLAKYGKLQHQEYGDVLKQYPRGRTLATLNDIGRVIREIEERDAGLALEQWLRLNVGPLPASEMPQRVAAACEQMITANGHGGRPFD